MWGFDFNVGLVVDVRVMTSALIGVLPLETHTIFLLLPTTLLVCRVILLNNVGTLSFGLAFGPVGLLADTMGVILFLAHAPQSYHLNYHQSIVVASCHLKMSAFHYVYPDLNPHLNWPFASDDKPFSDLCGQLELGKPKPLYYQTELSGLAVPGFSLHSSDSLDRSNLF
jgi:hypothetical protein